MVCSGTTPAGTEAGFGERHGSWSRRGKEQSTEYVEKSLSEILVYTPLVSAYLSHTLVPHLTPILHLPPNSIRAMSSASVSYPS
jgi:hypothetical protein